MAHGRFDHVQTHGVLDQLLEERVDAERRVIAARAIENDGFVSYHHALAKVLAKCEH